MGRHIYLRIASIIALLLLPPVQASHALDSGLEIESHKRIYVVIEETDDGDRQTGLTQELIRAKVELQLQRNGISLNVKLDKDGYLYVNVSTLGRAYNYSVEFRRAVTYSSEGRTYETVAAVWDKSRTGTFNRGSSYILQSLANTLDNVHQCLPESKSELGA